MTASRPAILVATTSLLVVACAGGGNGDGGSTSTPTAASVAALADVRAEVGPVAVDIGTAAVGVAAAVEALRSDEVTTDLVRDAAATLSQAADAATVVAVDDTFPEVQDRLTTVGDVGMELASAASDAADGLDAAEDRRVDLARLVDTWDANTSRSQQLAQLAEVEIELRELAADAPAAPSTCSQAERSWLDAAEAAADATAELRDLVASYDGLRYDARRAEVRAELQPETPVRASAATCAAIGDVDQIAELLDVALRELEAALNPAGLVDTDEE